MNLFFESLIWLIGLIILSYFTYKLWRYRDKQQQESPYEIMEIPIYTTIKGDKEFIDEEMIRNIFEAKLKERGRKK